MPTSSEPARAIPLSRNTDFIRLWTGGAASGLGATITNLAYPLLALSVTTSAGLAGLLGVVALTAGTVIRLPAGAVVDRVPLRRLLVGTDVVRIITTAALIASVVTGHLALWQLLVVAGINASAGAFRDVAHSVALRHIVSSTQLSQACAANEGRGHAISLIGQPVGGLLYGVTPALPLVADLASFGISATLSAGIRHRLTPPANDAPRPRFREDLLTGLHLGWTATAVFAAFGWVHQPVLAGALLGCIYVTATPANAVLFAAQINRTPAHRQGRVMAATLLIAGLAAPLGPPTSGILLDAAGPSATYVTLAALTASVTIAVHLNQPMHASHAEQ